jgi:hypothetical protein
MWVSRVALVQALNTDAPCKLRFLLSTEQVIELRLGNEKVDTTKLAVCLQKDWQKNIYIHPHIKIHHIHDAESVWMAAE